MVTRQCVYGPTARDRHNGLIRDRLTASRFGTRDTSADPSVGGQGTGTGSAGGRGDGVNIRSSSVVEATSSGAIQITGTGSGSDPGLDIDGTLGAAAGTGSLTLIGNTIRIDSAATLQGAGALTIKPRTSGTTLGLGGAAGTLDIDDTELARLADGFSSITIGDATSGDIDVDTATFNDPLHLITDAEVHDGAGTDIDMASGDTVTVNGTVAPGQSPGILTVNGNFAFADNATFEVEIGGTTPGTTNSDHDQLNVTGTVTIGNNVTLTTLAFGGFVPLGGDSFEIINRNGGTGTFSGLSQGAVVSANFFGSGLAATITYVGGDGDDVVVEVIPEADLSISKTDGVTSAVPGGSITYTIVVSNNGPSDDPSVTMTDTFPAALTAPIPASRPAGSAATRRRARAT